MVNNARAFMQGMTRADTFFHSLMAGTVVGGVLLFNVFGDSIWEYWNHGVGLHISASVIGVEIVVTGADFSRY